MTLLRKLAQSRRTLVLSIHQFADAERICDRLLLLDAGRVLAIGTLDELRELAGGHTLTLEEVVLALT
jgi:ABC-2 type transport system ATP-binding protein